MTTIFTYTNDQAIDDGTKVQIGPCLFATTNLLYQAQPDGDVAAFIHKVRPLMDDYNAGVFYHEGSTNYPEETNAMFATYLLNGMRVWAILDGDGLHLLLPEDY